MVSKSPNWDVPLPNGSKWPVHGLNMGVTPAGSCNRNHEPTISNSPSSGLVTNLVGSMVYLRDPWLVEKAPMRDPWDDCTFTYTCT